MKQPSIITPLSNKLQSVNIFEVGPRDGLQNEAALAPEVKVELINQLSTTGLKEIECGAFVSAKKIPQMADSDRVFDQINRTNGVTYSALTPNVRGLESALQHHVDQVAVFTSASEGFCQRNINCSISQSLERFTDVIELASKHKIPVRGYLSCVADCPYDGPTEPQQVARLTNEMLTMGCYQVSLGDTIGTATPNRTAHLLSAILKDTSPTNVAVHFHNTYGQALVNIYQSLMMGINTIDSSVAGLGGCPYAQGASGNVATEDVLYLCHGLGLETGVDLEKLVKAGWFICQKLNILPASNVSRALQCNFHT